MRSTSLTNPYSRLFDGYGSELPKTLHYESVLVQVGSIAQGGVQSVSVKAETGLDFVAGPLDKSGNIINNGAKVIIDITYAGCRTLSSAASVIGSSNINIDIIELGQQQSANGAFTPGANSARIEKCVLIGASSSVRAPGRGTYTDTYWGLWKAAGGAGAAGVPPAGSSGHFSCCTAHANAVAYESNIKLNYKYIYKKGSNAPYQMVLQYPVVSTESITYIGGVTTLSDFPSKPLSCNPAGAGNLESITIGGAQAGNDSSIQTYTYNYSYQDDYGVGRKITIGY